MYWYLFSININIIYYIFILTQVGIVYVILSSFVSQKYRILHGTVRDRALGILSRRNGQMSSANDLIQHLNPACRVARRHPYLYISKILMQVSLSLEELGVIELWAYCSILLGSCFMRSGSLDLQLAPIFFYPSFNITSIARIHHTQTFLFIYFYLSSWATTTFQSTAWQRAKTPGVTISSF